MNNDRENLQALTGFRFVVAFYIVVRHVAPPAFAHAPEWMQLLVVRGYVWQTFFLVLSGFFTAYSYATRPAYKSFDPRAFWKSRVARLYPAYAMGLVLAFPFFVRGATKSVPTLAAAVPELAITGGSALLMLQAWLPFSAMTWNTPGWSVSSIAFFYVVFPFVAEPLVRVARARPAATAAAIWAAAVAPALAYLWLDPDGIGNATPASREMWISVLKFNPLVNLPSVLCGVVICTMYLSRGVEPRARRLPSAALGLAALLVSVVLLAPVPYALVRQGLMLPLCGFCVYAVATSREPLTRWLRTPTLQFLGGASYVLAMTHLPLWVICEKLAEWSGVRAAGSAPFTAAFVALALAASCVVHARVERPAQAWLAARLFPRRAAPAAGKRDGAPALAA
jgi:peptidoglycan/LPS O-acetylase OafA/YrhL